MKHYFRLIYLFFSTLWKPSMGFLETSILKLRVWPTDIDLLLHMNNGVYLSLMDLGRTDLTLRSGFYRILRKNGIYPVIASEVIRFKKSLKPFQSFEIHTDLIYWDEKYFYLQQRFFSRKELYASGIVKARFLRNEGGGVDPLEIFRLLGLSQTELDQSLSRLAQEGKDAIVSYRGIENYLR